MTVHQIQTTVVNEQINLLVKVLKVNEANAVSSKSHMKPLLKQDCVIGDKFARCRVVLWEKDVGSLELGKSYKLTKVRVRKYGGMKYLSLSEDANVEEVEDIGDVVESGDGDRAVGERVVKGEVVAVLCG